MVNDSDKMETKAARKICFYADPDIADWYHRLPRHAGTNTINEMLRNALSEPKMVPSHPSARQALFLAFSFFEVQTILQLVCESKKGLESAEDAIEAEDHERFYAELMTMKSLESRIKDQL
jgi:hypothetical protein